ncbi:lamin tail domain-containing protein [Tenuifilum thalassicum]|uniref:LTD domain-containing protein n=1 Tax=Tenuifilum thalassicum TaxID=2590900 RepID=A0A7D4AYW6_9BACT|nr:lamin tail domain-containing protein [Tenuifilum thalassicum]QKG81074.1 hypothetical protein FHG85_12630 [Tenuifilum thalassicum]
MQRNLLLVLTLFAQLGVAQQVVKYDFETSNLSEWTQKPDNHWGISSSSAISGTSSLKHTYDNNISATDTIIKPLPAWDIDKGDITWRFLIRHGYDPSSSNSWWFYLMCDDKLSTANESGYAVGVNLTGSDDLLKLWRIENGVPQEILSSTLNWQTQVGTGNAAAIEVVRTSDGNFTLRASESGSFFSLSDYGNITDNTYKGFSLFGVGYRYSSAQDMKLWIDDISFIYQPINPNDRTTIVAEPLQQIPSADIPSTSTSDENGVDVLTFLISDDGSGDNLPTYVQKILIKNPYPDSILWSNLIGGVTLKKDGQLISILSASISNEQITLEVDSALATIPDGQTAAFTFGIYLKESNIPDNTKLIFEVDSQNHGFLSSLFGSGFAQSFPSKIQSNPFTIRVNASQAHFQNISPIAILGKPFSLELVATDDYGSIDSDYNGQISLSLAEGNGTLTSVNGLTQNAINGIAHWDSLYYNRHETIRIKAEGNDIGQTISEEILISYDTTSFASTPGVQVGAFIISSLADKPEDAKEIIRFKIVDTGTDGVATYLKKIVLNKTSSSTCSSLLKTIEGVLVKDGSTYIATSNIDIKTSSIEIDFPLGAFTIADGQAKELSIYIYLKNSGINDNQTIQLYIDKLNPEFEAYDTGTQFSKSFPNNINSAISSIDVAASRLIISDAPKRIGVKEYFTVKISSTDQNGNQDVDFNGDAELMLASGDGELNVLSDNPCIVENGIGQFQANYSKPGTFTLLARNTELNDAISEAITCADADGVVLPLIQPTDTVILTPNNSYVAAAQEVIRFKIKDLGSTDSLPLFLRRIKLLAFNPTNLPTLSRMVQGFVLEKDGNSINPSSFTFSSNTLQIDFDEGTVHISDNDSANFILKVYLNDREVVDAFQFQFYIPNNNHGWITFDNGTAFSTTFPSTIFGRPCRTEVKADRLKFAEQPFAVAPNETFNVSVMACDSRGNIDKEYQGYTSLEIYNGTGSLNVDPILEPLNNGIATWNNAELTSVGKYRLKAYFGWLTDAISDNIYCGYNHVCEINEGFENAPPSWQGMDDWLISRIVTLDGEFSLAHAGNANAKQSVLSIPISSPKGKAAEWSITIRNGDWDPSSENYFYLAFISSHENSMDNDAEGYAVGINPSSGNDYISIWRFDNGTRTPLIQSKYDWNENDEVKLTITLSPDGTIKLWYTPKSTGIKSFGGEAKITVPTASFTSFVFAFTENRAGELWIDDIRFCTTDFPPAIESAKVQNLNTVKVSFSKPVTEQSAANIKNYNIISSSNKIIEIQNIKIDDQETVTLQTEKLPFEKFKLYVDNIADTNGYSLADSIEFGLTAEGNFGRLVFNEIMANPTPSNGLPEYEYVELYNPGEDSVLTSEWKLTLNDKKVTLPADTIPPNSYALIGCTSAMSSYSQFGKTIPVASFPSLLNDGMLLKLFDPNGNLIAFANYTKDWYNDSTRNSGGYSMECIDYTNLAEGKNNWKASISTNGGTPCNQNSVAGANPDITPPKLEYLSVLDNQTLSLSFSEAMDSLSATLKENYSTNLKIDFIKPAGLFNQAIISFSEPILPNQVYDITISGVMDFSGNSLADTLIRFGLLQIPELGDLVINEILFNPYVGGTDFVEVFNNSDKTIDLSQVMLANRDEESFEIKENFPASDKPFLLFPQEFGVITLNPSLVKRFYTCQNPSAFIQVDRMASFNNDKGYVVLLNSNNLVIDELRYSETMHNELLNDVKGVSLERINPNLSTNDVGTWHSAAQAAGFATPTYKNSQFTELTESKSKFTLTPKIFSPDGDGHDDYLIIRYNLPEPGYVANIRIFTANGVEIYRLANNLTLGTASQLKWDGVDSQHRRVDSGIYIIFFEYFNLKGEVHREKSTCVVGYK